MMKWASLLGIGAALCVFSCGCSTTADGIAASYGTIGTSSWYKGAESRLVAMIESGEADRMVADDKTEKRTYAKGLGDNSVLVTEHLIQGVVYRVDVRNRVNPVTDIFTSNVRQVNYGPPDRSLQVNEPIQRADVLQTIANRSFAGQAQVAYRAYIGSNGQFHPVRTMPGESPEASWSDRGGIDLILRTDLKVGAGVTQFRGCRPNGLDRNGRLLEPDGRWIVLSEGRGVSPTAYFVNHALHPEMKAIGYSQPYPVEVLNAPVR